MWWFVRRGQADAQTRLCSEGNWAEEQLLASVPDMSPLGEHDVAVKLWLPEVVAQTLKWVADYEGVSQSSWLREHLMEYVYGSAAVAAHRIRAKRGESDIRFCISEPDVSSGRYVYKVPQLGKSAVAFKVWINRQLQQDLLALAEHAGLGLSPFLREVVIGALFGRGSLPERPDLLGRTTAEAQAWENGEPVPVAQMEETEFHGLGDAERVWVVTQDRP